MQYPSIQDYEILLHATFHQYAETSSTRLCNKLFNACFEIGDCICLAEVGGAVSEAKLHELSAVYVMRKFCEGDLVLDDELANKQVKLFFTYMYEGRLGKSIPIVQEFFKTKHGLAETIKNPNFKINFERLTALYEPS
jgi:hypothetical protein